MDHAAAATAATGALPTARAARLRGLQQVGAAFGAQRRAARGSRRHRGRTRARRRRTSRRDACPRAGDAGAGGRRGSVARAARWRRRPSSSGPPPATPTLEEAQAEAFEIQKIGAQVLDLASAHLGAPAAAPPAAARRTPLLSDAAPRPSPAAARLGGARHRANPSSRSVRALSRRCERRGWPRSWSIVRAPASPARGAAASARVTAARARRRRADERALPRPTSGEMTSTRSRSCRRCCSTIHERERRADRPVAAPRRTAPRARVPLLPVASSSAPAGRPARTASSDARQPRVHEPEVTSHRSQL